MNKHSALILGLLALAVCIESAVEKSNLASESMGAVSYGGGKGPSLIKQGIERGLWKWRKCKAKQRRGCYKKYGSYNCFKIWRWSYCRMRHFCSKRGRKRCWRKHKKGCRKFIRKERCRYL